jgi:hypothetical protein
VPSRLLRRILAEKGISLIELAVAMFITAIMSSLMISWVFSIAAADDLHLADDEAVQGVRIAKDEITRELRRAAAVLAAEGNSLTIWLDDDRNEVQSAEEVVTWEIDDGSGTLTRTAGDGDASIRLARVSAAESGFTFDAENPGEVTSVGLTLAVFVDAPRGDDGVRSLTTEISLRGVS